MLVLTRKENDAILIGDDIKITVVSISGDKVRIGIDAPSTVKILRRETIDQTIDENRIAATAKIDLAKLVQLKINS